MNAARDIAVLMYHTVDDGLGGDPVYHLGRKEFTEQLRIIAASDRKVTTVAEEVTNGEGAPTSGSGVVISFDDGASCHSETVVPLLLDHGLRGEFFVNPGTVGQPGHVDWACLRDMVDAGMSIQSHGYTHSYLDSIDEARLLDELSRSRHAIEDRLGSRVSVLAAPGGRINHLVASLAKRVGYAACCGSRPGIWSTNNHAEIIPRFPVRAMTAPDELSGWLRADRRYITPMQLRYRTLWILRNLLGNNAYEGLRRRYLRSQAGPVQW